jgi:hypothetical protein
MTDNRGRQNRFTAPRASQYPEKALIVIPLPLLEYFDVEYPSICAFAPQVGSNLSRVPRIL